MLDPISSFNSIEEIFAVDTSLTGMLMWGIIRTSSHCAVNVMRGTVAAIVASGTVLIDWWWRGGSLVWEERVR